MEKKIKLWYDIFSITDGKEDKTYKNFKTWALSKNFIKTHQVHEFKVNCDLKDLKFDKEIKCISCEGFGIITSYSQFQQYVEDYDVCDSCGGEGILTKKEEVNILF